MATYSFMDVTATFAGPTGVIDLGYGSAPSKEGISVEFNQPRNNMTPGADGEVMHSLRADKVENLRFGFFIHPRERKAQGYV